MLDMVPVPDRVISSQIVIMGGGEIVRPDQVSELSERGGGMDAGNFDILIAGIQTVQKRVPQVKKKGHRFQKMISNRIPLNFLIL